MKDDATEQDREAWRVPPSPGVADEAARFPAFILPRKTLLFRRLRDDYPCSTRDGRLRGFIDADADLPLKKRLLAPSDGRRTISSTQGYWGSLEPRRWYSSA